MNQSKGSEGRGDGTERRDAGHPDAERADAERPQAEADRWSAETGYQPSGNQVRDEPVPASRHEERGQEAVVRNEEHAAGDLKAGPSGKARSE